MQDNTLCCGISQQILIMKSVKNADSFIAKKIVVGNAWWGMGVKPRRATLDLLASKGEYSGADTENLLLDFFFTDTTL